MQQDDRLETEPAAHPRPTWGQRRSAGEITLIVLAIFTVYVAVHWWSFGRGGGPWIRIGLVWTGAALALGNLFFVRRRLGDADSRRLFRRALRDGLAQPGVDTSRWRVQLESSLRQSDDRWTTLGTIWTGALGGVLLLVSVGPRGIGPVTAAAGLGAVGGIALAALMVSQQRRSRRRVVALLQDLDS